MPRDLSVTRVGKEGCNLTSLNLETAEKRNIFHRDIFAHWLRYQYITQIVERHVDRVLDLGCGEGNLVNAMYANMLGPSSYMGVDLRRALLERNAENINTNFELRWVCADLTKEFPKQIAEYDPDLVTCLEMLEHIPPECVEPLLVRIKAFPHLRDAVFSTPCFNGITKAANHVKEWTYEELREVMERVFPRSEYTITKFGTFISMTDLEKVASLDHLDVYHKLKNYYNSNIISLFLAPLYPAASRNCLWHVRKIEVARRA